MSSFPPAPLLPIAVSCCLGLGLGPTLGVPGTLAGVVGLALLAAGFCWPRCASVAVAVGWLLLGLGRGAAEPPPPPMDGELLWAVRVDEDGRDPRGRPIRGTLLAAWESVGSDVRRGRWRGEAGVVVRVPAWPGEPARRGEVWLARGKVRAGPRGASLPVRRAARLVRLRPATVRPRLDAALGWVRDGARKAVNRGAPPELRSLFLALALGDRRGLDPALRAQLSRTGTAHLVALSGLHVGTALLAAAGSARWILRRLAVRLGPDVAWPGGADTLSLWVGLAAATTYVFVAGAPVSAQRALTMATVCVVAVTLGRRPSGWNALALAALLVGWLDPAAVRGLGFQLSVASVAGLLAAAPWTTPSGPWLVRWVLGAAGTSVAATVATAPLLGAAFGQVPVASLWTNPVAIPLLGGLTVPPLLLGAGLGCLSPDVGAAFVRLAAIPASAGLGFLQWASLPDRAPLLGWSPEPWQVGAIYAAAGLPILWRVRSV